MISFIAMIFSVFVLKLLKMIINFTPQLKMMIKEIKKEDDLYEKVKNSLKIIKHKIFFVFIIQYVLMICMSYYLALFSIVFHSNQKNVFYNTIISFALSIAISFAFFGFFAFMQKFALNKNHEFLFYCFKYIQNKL